MAVVPGEIASVWLDRIGKATEPLTQIVVTHLCCEFWLNRILAERHGLNKSLDKIGFSRKLGMLEELGELPADLVFNLQLLNSARNAYAHRLNWSMADEADKFKFRVPPDDGPKVDLAKNFADIRIGKAKNSLHDAHLIVGLYTFGWLTNHCVNLGFQSVGIGLVE